MRIRELYLEEVKEGLMHNNTALRADTDSQELANRMVRQIVI